MDDHVRFSPEQKKITILCVIAYSVLYFMRLNISLALSGMEETFSVSPEELGIVSSVFFWLYAFGQLIFGFLGDRLPVRYMVFTGLLGSAILNLGISIAPNISWVIVLWAINGVFQSMLWSPMMKCVSKHFSGAKMVIATFCLSITQVIGYIAAWAGSYLIDNFLGWRYVFAIPSALGILFSIIWVFTFRYSSKTGPVEKKTGSSLMRQPILITFLGVIAVFSILFGLIKSSLDTWLPTMISDVGSLPESGIIITLILIPLVNFGGIMLSKSVVKKVKGDIYKTVFMVWGCALAISGAALFLFNFNSVVFVVLIAILFGFVYALTPLFTSFIPLDFAKWDCVSTVTGFVDFAIYVGAGITGIVSGLILGDSSNKNWSALSSYWLVLLAIGFVFAIGMYLWHRQLRRKINKEESEWD